MSKVTHSTDEGMAEVDRQAAERVGEKPNCAANGHVFGSRNVCMFCGAQRPMTAPKPDYRGNPPTWPVGTNLFSYTEAKAMVEHMLTASPQPPVSGGWRDMQTVPLVDDAPILLLTSYNGVTEARYSPGYWTDHHEGREYSGPVWVCGDDEWQIEIEEISKDPSEWRHGSALGWLPRSALPAPPAAPEAGR